MGKTESRVWFTLFVLLAVNTLNFYDRQVIGAVAEPLREDLSLSDFQLGWMTPAFVLLYAAVGIPLGRWADVGSRTRILAVGLAFWSVLTALSGVAWDFWSLFAARLGVGIGEASCAPTANSLVGDLFPRERRAKALGIFMIGLPVGLSLSSAVSGKIAQLWGWRAAFLLAGIPGLALAVLCFRLPEPARGSSEQHSIGTTRRAGNPWLLVLGIPTMWPIILSGALHNFNMYALGQFLSPLLQRYHGLAVQDAGYVSSAAYACGGIGIFLGGWACDWMVRRRVSGRLEVSAFALAVATPCLYLALLQAPGQWGWFTFWLMPGCLCLYVYYSGVYATIQDIVEPALRGTAMATYFFVMYLFAAFGPVVLGWVSGQLAARAAADAGADEISAWHRALGLHEAFTLIPILGIALVVVLLIASRTVTKDYERLQKWMQSKATGSAASV